MVNPSAEALTFASVVLAVRMRCEEKDLDKVGMDQLASVIKFLDAKATRCAAGKRI